MSKWQYGVVIDAGSSGSRVHVYRWLNFEEARKEEDYNPQALPVVKTKKDWNYKIKPGISTFAYKVQNLGPDHLQDLLDHALEIVPAEQVPSTPIFLLATAGMRLLQDLEKHDVLAEVCSYITKHSDFLLPDCSLHVQVIPGSTEGLYGWLATNYLLGGFDSAKDHDHGKGHHTYGFLDMGGASAQIAFAPNATEAEKHSNDLKLVRMRNANGTPAEYKVFVTTWLGFGVNQVHERYIEALAYSKGVVKGLLPDPCLPKGITTNPEGDILRPEQIDEKKTPLVGTGNFEECLNRTLPLLNKDKPCKDEPCLLDGVHVPAIDFDVNHFVGVSEYWHTTHEIFEMGHGDRQYDFAAYKKLVSEFCSQKWENISKDVENGKFGKKITERDAADICFKASWIINMLHTGIGVPMAKLSDLPAGDDEHFLDPFQTVDKVDDTEVSWTLGKMILYASSQVPPAKTNNMPVGFGMNIDGKIPVGWEYAGGEETLTNHIPNSTAVEDEVTQGSESWRDTLFEGNTPRRLPGFLIFLVIVVIVTFLLCGRDRRARFFRRFRCCGGGRGAAGAGRYGRRRDGRGGPKTSFNGQDDHMLESGMINPDDFELGDVQEEGAYSDEAGKTGMASGWETPRMRTPMSESFGEGSSASGSGLIPRTESRERLTGAEDRGRRSRRASPTRLRSPLIGTVSPA